MSRWCIPDRVGSTVAEFLPRSPTFVHALDMQNRYAGDLGDYLKFGLLRCLCAPKPNSAALRLGVVWYLVPDESHNADGKHTAYLDSGHASALELRRADPELYDQLASVVAAGVRSVAALERAGVLPANTATYSTALQFRDLPITARSARSKRREDWLSASLLATVGCDVVFVDPDNGVRPTDHPSPRHRNKAEKHAYLDEIAAFTDRGQSVIAYQHADRSAPVDVQARLRLNDLALATGKEPLAAVRASRGSTRLYLISADQSHDDRLDTNLRDLSRGPWSREFFVYWRT